MEIFDMIRQFSAKHARYDRFIEEYLKDLNATQAAIRAGYSTKTAREQASRLLAKVNIQEKIAELARRRQEDAGIETKRILTENARIALSSITKLFGENGTLKAPREWPDEIASAVSTVEVVEIYQGRGKDRKLVGHIKKVKLWDKNSALDRFFRYLGLFERDHKHQSDPIKELLKEINDRAWKYPLVKDPDQVSLG